MLKSITKEADKLYIPLDQIPLLHRYSGSETSPSLNGLYDGKWEKTRRNAHVPCEMAKNICEMFKARQRLQGLDLNRMATLSWRLNVRLMKPRISSRPFKMSSAIWGRAYGSIGLRG